MLKAKIVADSVNLDGHRVTTFLLTYHRYIHSELMTHRVFGRNAASSRAIPTKRFREDVRNQPATPTHWGHNQPGMQASSELDDTEVITMEFPTGPATGTRRALMKKLWLEARDSMLVYHELAEKIGAHKQITNRLLEPWMWIQVLVTATEFGNWFALRSHPAAHPDLQGLSDIMLKEYVTSVPVLKKPGEWHLPYGDQHLPEGIDEQTLLKVCVARAARLSYMKFDATIVIEDDCRLHDDLLAAGHMSPFEHPCQAVAWNDNRNTGHLRGWRPYRKMITGENRDKIDLMALALQRGLLPELEVKST